MKTYEKRQKSVRKHPKTSKKRLKDRTNEIDPDVRMLGYVANVGQVTFASDIGQDFQRSLQRLLQAVQTFERSNARTLKCPKVQMFVQTSERPNVRTFKRLNIRMFDRSNVQNFKLSNVRTLPSGVQNIQSLNRFGMEDSVPRGALLQGGQVY